MDTLKSIKRATLHTLKTAGAFHLTAGSRWRRRQLLILAYHGVSQDDEHEWRGDVYISQSVFRARLAALRRFGAAVLPLEEAVERLYADDLPDRAIALTFDDGTYDFYSRAYPVLREFGFPVTLYLTTYYTRFAQPVFDPFCSYLLWKAQGRTLSMQTLTGASDRFNLANDDERAAALQSIRVFSWNNNLTAKDKDDLLRKVAREVRVDYDRLNARRILHLVNPDEVRELAAAGVDVQLHAHRHRAPQDRELFFREIEENRAYIRALTGGHEARHFCYPSNNHAPCLLPWLAECGVKTATTCEVDYATRMSHALMLPRLLDKTSLSMVEFEAWLSGVAAIVPRRPVATAGR